MARPRNQQLMQQIKELASQGCTDSDISRILNRPANTINHYRKKLLGLEPNWLKRTFASQEEKTVGYMLRNIRFSAKRRNIHYDMDVIDLLPLPIICPLLNIPLQYNKINTMDLQPFNSLNWATVDRIDNTKGYVKGNVWIISRLANNMKNCASLDQLGCFANNILKVLENHRALGSITAPLGLDS